MIGFGPETVSVPRARLTRRASRGAARAEAEGLHAGFIERLVADFRGLDPACGAGNFLYLALLALKDVERFPHRANLDAEALGLGRGFPPGLTHESRDWA